MITRAPCCCSTRYRQCHKVEYMFGKLKDWRRVATRYDRCAHTFFSDICIAAFVIFYLNQWVPTLGCLVPAFDCTFLSVEWKDALWDRFYTAAPRRQRRSVEQYKIVNRA